MKRFFWVLFVMSLWGHLLMAQEKAVSGIVVSTEDGLPMIGVAVVDKQTMNGVTTNEKGEFSMTVSPRTKTLHLSYLGYKTKEVTISGRSMKIEMEPDMVAIDEVMVVAYGTGKKSTYRIGQRGQKRIAGEDQSIQCNPGFARAKQRCAGVEQFR